MMMKLGRHTLVALFLAAAVAAGHAATVPALEEFARSPRYQWNGVAVSKSGRVFASFPRWLSADTISVGEIRKDGSIVPIPGGAWNLWRKGEAPKTAFVSVNAVFADAPDRLWVVDPAAPAFGPVIPGGPKLVEIDLKTNRVARVYSIGADAAPGDSYLNDVRIDGDYAYLSESGIGSIIVLDLKTGKARRRLASEPSTKADPSVVPKVDGRELRNAQGKVPQVNVDPIEMSPDHKYLYYQAAFGPNVYRVRLEDLRDSSLSDDALEHRVELVRHSPPIGGFLMDERGNFYLSEFETHSVECILPGGKTSWKVTDPRLDWPDALSLGPDGYLY
ncbi:MAG: L-dopachrome tautomerase-related protein, partial [Bryobacteraceae bacterium]